MQEEALLGEGVGCGDWRRGPLKSGIIKGPLQRDGGVKGGKVPGVERY